jgi:hypothetical protein
MLAPVSEAAWWTPPPKAAATLLKAASKPSPQTPPQRSGEPTLPPRSSAATSLPLARTSREYSAETLRAVDAPANATTGVGHKRIIAARVGVGAAAATSFDALRVVVGTAYSARGDETAPLVFAAAALFDRAALVADIVKAGGNVNGADNAGATPLHAACFAGSLEGARELLARGAVVDTAVPVRELIARGARLGVREGDLHASIRHGQQPRCDFCVQLQRTVTQPHQKVFTDVRYVLELREGQEPRRALDGVNRAKDTGQPTAVIRSILQRHQVLVQLVKVLVTLYQKLFDDIVEHFHGCLPFASRSFTRQRNVE